MIELFNFNKLSTYIIWFVIIIIIKLIFTKFHNNQENFMFGPWNMGTRFYPSYDIRGYPLIYPWNYPFPGTPYLYWSPYFYEASGKYTKDLKYAKLLNSSQNRVLST
jgi:hypothetical protein